MFEIIKRKGRVVRDPVAKNRCIMISGNIEGKTKIRHTREKEKIGLSIY